MLLYEWQQYPQTQPAYNRRSKLPEGAESYLRLENPRLKALRDRYAVFNSKVTDPLVWKESYVGSDDILYFRGDNAYVWQLRGLNMNAMAYALTTYYVKSIDKLGLLMGLKENNFFGNFTFNIADTLVSRDLLDSIVEIYFLEKYLNIFSSDHLTILDIGAGYGRLAHRMVCSLPNIVEYFCTDAVPESTFVCEYYVRFCKIEDRVKVVPLDEIESVMRRKALDLAINIHSFSECKTSAIEWWLSVLKRYNVKYLMVAPNFGDSGGKLLLTNDGEDFGKIIEKYGYKLVAKEPKYQDPTVQQNAISPTYYHLFELN